MSYACQHLFSCRCNKNLFVVHFCFYSNDVVYPTVVSSIASALHSHMVTLMVRLVVRIVLVVMVVFHAYTHCFERKNESV